MDIPVYAPVFPLSSLNLLPETTAVYHIFEPRYRKMITSALEGDRCIAMALLKPGFEENYYGNPEIYPVGCLGSISRVEHLEDGNFNIILEGRERVGLGELVQDYPFRVVRLQRLPENDLEEAFEDERHQLQVRLEYLARHASEEVDFSPLLRGGESFRSLLNLVAKTLPLDVEAQYGLLTMDSMRERARRILWHLDDHIDTLELLKRVDPSTSDDISLN